jgi:fatty acid desaturase
LATFTLHYPPRKKKQNQTPGDDPALRRTARETCVPILVRALADPGDALAVDAALTASVRAAVAGWLWFWRRWIPWILAVILV